MSRSALHTISASLLAVMVAALAAPPCRAADGAAARLGPTTLRGRCVDEQGKPVPNVRVSAAAPAAGQILWLAQTETTRTRTDDEGRFALPVPFAGVLYSVLCERLGYSSQWARQIPGEGAGPLEVRLTREPHRGSFRAAVSGPEGNAVAGADVLLVGEYGYVVRGKSDAAGGVRIGDLPEYLGQAVPIVHVGGMVAPLEIVRRPTEVMGLRLGPPGVFEVEALDLQTGGPLVGAQVVVRPAFASGFSLSGVTDERGVCRIEAIPPGEYTVAVSSSTHYDRPPGGQGFNRKSVVAAAGKTERIKVRLQASPSVRGRVLDENGNPAADAIVGMPCTFDGDYRNQNRYVHANAKGEFTIHTAHTGEELTMQAFTAEHGVGHVQIRALADGETRDDVLIVLSGAARVRGTVTGAAGKPVPNVLCSIMHGYDIADMSDAQGKFDLGRVPLVTDPRQKNQIDFKPPRPTRGGLTMGAEDQHRGKAGEPETFYENLTHVFDVKPGGLAEVNANLKPTDLIVLSGTVLEPDGKTPAKASIHIFQGNAGDDTWLETAAPDFSRGFGGLRKVHDHTIAVAHTDAEGKWRARVVRAEGKPGDGGTLYSVAAVRSDRVGKLTKDVIVPMGKTAKELTIRLEAPAGKDAGAGEEKK